MLLLCAVVTPFVGAIVDKYPARLVFACGLLGMAVFYLAVSFITAAWQLLALYGLLAPVALVLCTSTPVNALITRWFVQRRGLALGLSAFGLGMAGVLLPPLIAATLPAHGWRSIWRIGGLLVALVVAPLVVMTIRDRACATRRSRVCQRSRCRRPDGRRPARRGGRPADLARYPCAPEFLAGGGDLSADPGAEWAPATRMSGLTRSGMAGARNPPGAMLSVLSLSQLVSNLVLGIVSDRFGNRAPFAILSLFMAAGRSDVCRCRQPNADLRCVAP